MKNPINIKIANKLIYFIKKYIERHEKRVRKRKKKNFEKLFNGNQYFIHKLDENSIIKLYKDSVLSEIIIDGFEKSEEIFIKKFLKKDDIFIDIGSNIGIHSLFASQVVEKKGKVYAFEPTPQTFNRLQENIQLNEKENIIVSVNKGLSDSNGVLTLNLSSDGHDAWNSFTPLQHIKQNEFVKVNVVTLDSFIKNELIDINKIALIKIDVEGWELNVLKGADDFLKNNVKTAFLIEFTDKNAISAGYCSRDIYRLMESFGYKWYEFDPILLELIPSPIKHDYPYENLIAIKDKNSTIKNRLK